MDILLEQNSALTPCSFAPSTLALDCERRGKAPLRVQMYGVEVTGTVEAINEVNSDVL